MSKKQFKAESKRLLDLMINSIYTNKEIFLREIISNASDAIDKLCYLSLTDEQVGLNRADFRIDVSADKDARTITVKDNGIGMSMQEAENNLGVIAKSGSGAFKAEMDNAKAEDLSIIGQFGVGFYSAFMVSDKVTVLTRKYGEEKGVKWESSGADGYTVTEIDRDSRSSAARATRPKRRTTTAAPRWPTAPSSRRRPSTPWSPSGSAPRVRSRTTTASPGTRKSTTM